jgi:tRNA(Ile)-lysidine synthetase-like protein
MVALSGGIDSVALLHLLRFAPDLPAVTLSAAHVDHGMRADSAADAHWVAGLCRAWAVPLEVHRLATAPADEAGARAARYAALHSMKTRGGADRLLTAHQADDQAETVLFGALRGTGMRGLRGIAERRAPGVWRPLLPFTRDDILAYALAVGLTWREDPTNEGGYPRNVLRHQVLPLVERAVAPGARRALRGLARRARDDEAAWRSLEPELLARVDAQPDGGGYSVDRDALLGLHPAVRGRLLRALVARLDRGLSDTGTRLAVEFTSAGSSGGSLPLRGGIQLHRDLDRLRVAPAEDLPPEQAVSVPEPGEGRARAVLGGCAYDVAWGGASVGSARPSGRVETFAAGRLAFPLTVRSWRPGDRIRLVYGSKKLKKLFLEARVPSPDRHRMPVLADAHGAVLWVPGVARAAEEAGASGTPFHIRITHAEPD